MKNQKGFTLVEMAIVLVIIGLLLGGVLKGQELIDSSKIKNATNDINGTIAAYNGYVDRFRAVPGDDKDANIAQRGAAWTTITVGSGDGLIASENPFLGETETGKFWQMVRAAGFISGNPADTLAAAVPSNAFSGKIGVTSGAVIGIAAGVPKVCLGSIPGKAARAMDIAMDDGDAAKGIFQAVTGGANISPIGATAATTYSDDSLYTVCRSM